MDQVDAIAGAILGCAVGDAIGLPYEGLSKRRGVRLLGDPDRYRFAARWGMVSDDTEHTCMVAQALCEAPTDPDAFAHNLARRMRWWLLGVPAGIGSATLRSILKLWLGFSPSRSGVFSAGNGPAMRSAVLGVAIDDLDALRSFVRTSTRITHTDPKAYQGALVIALAAWCAKRGLTQPETFLERYRALVGRDSSEEFDTLLAKAASSVVAGDSTATFADQLGCHQGVSGYVYRTVPVAIHSWLCNPSDYRQAIATVIRCGGDTDTTAAIVGAVVGSSVGPSGIPAKWRDHLWEWPRSVAWMGHLAQATGRAVKMGKPVRPPWIVPVVGLVRNAFFFTIVMYHVIRRLLPPY